MRSKPNIRALDLDDIDNFFTALHFFTEKAPEFGWSNSTIESAKMTLIKISSLRGDNAESIILDDANQIFSLIKGSVLAQREQERNKRVRPPKSND